MHRYKCFNAAMVTTSPITAVTTGTSAKTMLQIATPSTRQIQLISWGFTINANQNGTVELIETNVAATVTAHVAAGVQPLDPGQPASLMTLGTSATGYTATGEGSITTTRLFDWADTDADTDHTALSSYRYQWMPDERPIVAVSKFLRVRASFGTTTNMVCWICWDE